MSEETDRQWGERAALRFEIQNDPHEDFIQLSPGSICWLPSKYGEIEFKNTSSELIYIKRPRPEDAFS